MPAKDPFIYLMHIRDACEAIQSYSRFLKNPAIPERIVLDAVCRRFEIIGEASRKIDPEFCRVHPEVPWRQMANLRNVLIHDYEGTDPEIVWGIVERDIPPLLAGVCALLEAEGR